jgi:hypothetical protein
MLFGLSRFTSTIIKASHVIKIRSLSLLVLPRRLGEIPFLKAPDKTTNRSNMVGKQNAQLRYQDEVDSFLFM